MNARLVATLVALACGMACPRLFVQPLRELALAKIGFAADDTALVVAAIMIAHTLRPMIGLGIDASARRGVDPRWWLRVAAATALVAGLASGAFEEPTSGLLVLLALVFGCAVVVELVTSAAIVGEQARGAESALLGSARTFVATGMVLVTGVAAGWVAEAPSRRLGPLIATLMSLALVASWAIPRTPRSAVPSHGWRSTSVLVAACLAFTFYTVPGFGTLLFIRQRGEFGLSQIQIGGLESLNNFAALLGVLAYYRLRRRAPLSQTLPAAVAIYGVGDAMYLFYGPDLRAPAIEVVNGLLTAAGLAAIAEMVIRGAGREARALSIAVILCAANIGTSAAEIIGTKLGGAGLSFTELVLLHVACYLALAAAMYTGRARLALDE